VTLGKKKGVVKSEEATLPSVATMPYPSALPYPVEAASGVAGGEAAAAATVAAAAAAEGRAAALAEENAALRGHLMSLTHKGNGKAGGSSILPSRWRVDALPFLLGAAFGSGVALMALRRRQ